MNKLENVEGMQPSQLAKYYFPDYPLKARKEIERLIPFNTIEQFNDKLFNSLQKIEEEKIKSMPILLNSIALNSLGFEYNEQLDKTCYLDYKNKHISKFGKGFIRGQYEIYRNENDKLLLMDADNLNDVVLRLEKVVALMIKLGVLGMFDFEEHLEAIEQDPKSIQGIVNKVLKNKNQ